MKEYMEARILSVAQYTIDHNSTVHRAYGARVHMGE